MSFLLSSLPISSTILRNVGAISSANQFCRFKSNISNKRITRIPNDFEVDKSELETTGNERFVDVKLTNRNPRNLEQLLYEPKPMGFELDEENHHFWNKVIFEKKAKHLTARVVHNSGRTLITASTDESIISANLDSSSSSKAAQALGQILALRTLEAGINSVYCEINSVGDSANKVSAFIRSFEENGISLTEQPFIFARQKRDR